MTDTVYLVWYAWDEYESPSLEAIYTTREAAQALIDSFGKRKRKLCEIEPFPLSI